MQSNKAQYNSASVRLPNMLVKHTLLVKLVMLVKHASQAYITRDSMEPWGI